MPILLGASKAAGKISSWRHCASEVKARLGLLRNHQDCSGLSQIRRLGILPVPAGARHICRPSAEDRADLSIGNHHRSIQTRWFLGCGDGEEGNVLSKTYEERRVIGYSPEQLFAVVAAVDLYQDFVPWCQSSKIIKHNADGSFDAELEIGFKFLVESYLSHVEMKKPKSIKTTASQSGLFDHLINVWEFNPGPVPGTCDLYFLVDFKFQSPLYRQVASMFFKEVVARMIGSFTDRCRKIYGPGVRVLESSYGQ